MMRIKRCGLLMIILSLIALLLVISCRQSSDSKRNGTGEGARVQEEPTKGVYNGALKVNLKELLVKFRLSDEEKQIVYKMQKIVTNPNIGNTEGYKTYDDLKFYNLLKDLGERKVKEIVGNYLKVDKRQNEVKNAFSQAINNAPEEGSLKERLQSELSSYQDGYALQLKELFKDDDSNAVYGAFTANNYVVKAIREIDVQLNELINEFKALGVGGSIGAATGATVTESAEGILVTVGSNGVGVAVIPKNPADIADTGGSNSPENSEGSENFAETQVVRLEFDDEEKRGISAIRKLVTSPSQDYKTYNDSEFDGLIGAWGVLNTKEVVKIYNEHVAECETMKSKLSSKINDIYCWPKLQNEFKSTKICSESYIRMSFSQFNYSTDRHDLHALPNSDSVYHDMLNLGRFCNFKRVEQYLANSVKYKEMEGKLTESQKSTFRYINDRITEPGFCIYFLLGGLSFAKLAEVANLHQETIQAKDATSKALVDAPNVKTKRFFESQFVGELENYHRYLKNSHYKSKSSHAFYAYMMVRAYVNNFNSIKEKVLNLSSKNGAGSKPEISPVTT
ncbi:hypothetical protein bcCo53_001249 (plasmid) [Borrelia coriaceae]|uniref:Uncharacterized protein n=1 Tax=Borrelia coriaceae ATCC 43381 TaxID=1408429 RepID=W5SWD8_9SPIR|nr:hypothetical protein [Borrelia coriaceae]AHH11202.1 Hypothetical protein BCO_0005806 [Borrelia coriaceae ATCC 43381]UPA17080.1 hypothetical protein bcCo53_001249 [Borrelia coriaceae]